MKSSFFCLISRLAFAAASVAAISLQAADKDVIMQAMTDELARTTAELKLEKSPSPYFAAYRVIENGDVTFSASFGALQSRDRVRSRRRSATVELRVGTPQFDQTYYLTNSSNAPFATSFSTGLPLDDNYLEVRRQLWLATDNAYKRSTDWLAKKKAALQNKTRPDGTGDFTAEPPTQTTEAKPALAFDQSVAEQLVKEISAVFREFPAVATSSASLSASDTTVRYVNSEGTTYTRRDSGFMLTFLAAGQAPDGRSLADASTIVARSLTELQSKDKLLADARALGQRITDLASARLPESYNGPVLFEPEAVAEVFLQVFVPRLVAMKRPVVGSQQFAGYVSMAENPFQDKIGGRVLPVFLGMTDEPRRENFNGAPLFGTAETDDEGVPTRKITLVEGGRIKTLLTDRVPTPGLVKSTGSRHGGGPFPSNLIVTASETMTPAALRAELLKLAQLRGRDYGYVVRRVTRPMFRGLLENAPMPDRTSGRIEPAVMVYKLYTDGHEELVRNAEISSLTLSAFKDIVAAGQDPIVYHSPLFISRVGGLNSSEMVSLVVPSMIFDDITIKPPASEASRPLISAHPYFAK